MSPSLEVEALRQICSRLLDQVEARFGPEIPLDGARELADYWQINIRDAYTLASSPRLEAGEFQSDLAEVVEALARPDSELVIWHDLDHLAGVLRGIAFWDLPT